MDEEPAGAVDHPAVQAMQAMYARVVEGDWDGYRAMLADDYVSLGPGGTVKGPDRTLEDWRAAVEVLELDVEPEAVRQVGEGTVVVVARYADRSRRDGEVREDEGTMMEVWTRREDGSWRCRATHFD